MKVLIKKKLKTIKQYKVPKKQKKKTIQREHSNYTDQTIDNMEKKRTT